MDSLLLSWDIEKVSKRGKMLWSLVCPAMCWAIWLERNQCVFEGCKKPAYAIYLNAKDLACFGGLRSMHEEYSVTRVRGVAKFALM